MHPLFLIPGIFCSAVGFLKMWKLRWLPHTPAPERVAWQYDGGWFHNLKNLTTEAVRADPQWWGKFLSFVIVTLLIWGVVT